MKKIISFAVCLCMLFSAAQFLAAGSSAYSDNPFSDVPENAWYTESVLWCYQRGYMAGSSKTTFSPSEGMTRAMTVTLFAAVAGADLTTGEFDDSGFNDVPNGKWFSRPVAWAAKTGVTSGTGGSMFSPEATVTREQFMLMLRRLLEYTGTDVSFKGGKAFDAFGDAETASAWAKESLSWAAENDLISGTGKKDGVPTLSPKGTVTRAQAAVFTRAALEKNLGGEYPVGSISLAGTDISEFTVIYSANYSFKLHDDNKETAEFLAKAIKDICGAELEIYLDTERPAVEGAHEILIGKTDREDAGFVTVDRDFDNNAYIYEMSGNYLIFTCPVDRYGSAFAVTRFLEDVCGATYYGSGLFGYKSMKSASIEDGVRVAKVARFENIDNWVKGGNDQFLGVIAGDDIMLNLSHSLPLLGCPGCEHGDKPTSSHHIYHYSGRDPCLSEPDSIDTIIKNVGYILNDKLGSDKTRHATIHVSQSDSAKYCMCEHCKAVYRLWGMGATYVQIMTYVSEAFSDEYPNVEFVAYGCDQTARRPRLPDEISDENYQAFLEKYGNLKYVPAKDITPPDNCILLLKADDSCESHPLTDPDCPRNVNYIKNVAGWCQVYKKILVNAFSGSKYSKYNPFPDIYELRESISFFAGIENYAGYRYFSFDGHVPEYGSLRAFLMSRVTWEPDISEKAYSDLIDSYVKTAYGAGYTFMREYIDRMEQLSSANHWWTYKGVGDRWNAILTREQWTENHASLCALLDRALELCDTDEQAKAVRNTYIPLKYIGVRLAYAQYKDTGAQADFNEFVRLNKAFYNELGELGRERPDNWTETLDPERWEL